MAVSYRLYLDDVRHPPKHEADWIWAKSFDQAVAHVKQHGVPDEVSFDYDLGEGYPTGLDFAKWLVDYVEEEGAAAPPIFQYDVHSTHFLGAGELRAYLSQALPQ